MSKLSAVEVGKIALIILKHKYARQGAELRPGEFIPYVTKRAQLIGCTREELLQFFSKYLLPEVLHSCELTGLQVNHEPSEREVKIAYRLLKMEFFWNLRGLREEVHRIATKTSLKFEEVAPIAIYVARKHLRDEFEEEKLSELDIEGSFELK